MYASVVVVEDTNLTNGWSNDTLSFKTFKVKKGPTFLRHRKKNGGLMSLDGWCMFDRILPKKEKKAESKNGDWVASRNQKKQGVGSKNQKDHHATKQVKHCLSRTGQNIGAHGVDRMIDAIPP